MSDKLDLPCIVASRGRNPDNPSSRKAGIDTEQRLEVNAEGTANCLTSVGKDNWVLEPSNEIQYLGSIGNTDRIGDGKNLSRNSRTGDRVYSTDGVATTISAEGGGVGGHTGLYLEPTKDAVVSKLNKSAKHQQDLVQSDSGVCRTLVVGSHLNSDTYTKTVVDTPQHKYPFRIRKLTPKECWRLQGFDDEDIDKCIASGVSSSQLYKQAGNSIAVNCLEAIFGSLLGIEREFEVDDDFEMRLF